MQSTPEIRRRPDGSIDTVHYARTGRALHGAAMRDAGSKLVRVVRGWVTDLARRRASASDVQEPQPVFSAAE